MLIILLYLFLLKTINAIPKQIFIKEDNLNEYDINKKLVDKFEERKKRNSMSQFSNKYHKNNVKIIQPCHEIIKIAKLFIGLPT